MKPNKIDPEEFKTNYPYLNNRVTKQFSYFRSALANLVTLLGFIGMLTIVLAVSYFGIIGGLNEIERQNCESYQAYILEYPESSIRDEDITRCGALGIEIE